MFFCSGGLWGASGEPLGKSGEAWGGLGDGLGGFRVLVQEKKLSNKSPVSFDSSTLQTQLHQLPIPLMRSEHISLMSARYPHIGFLDEELQ